MKRHMFLGAAVACVLAAAVTAQTQTTTPKNQTMMSGDVKVRVNGCLERDMGAGASASTTSPTYKLTRAEVKIEDKASATPQPTGTFALAVTSALDDKDSKPKVEFAAHVDEKVELEGTISQTDLNTLKAKSSSTASAAGEMLPRLKATSISMLASKCS